MTSRGTAVRIVAVVVAVIVLAVAATLLLNRTGSGGNAPRAGSVSSASVDLDPRPITDRPVTVSPGERILFYGDSLTVGSFATTDANTFRGRLVTATRMVPEVYAQKGIFTGGFARKWPTAPTGISLAVVELGTNDVKNTEPEAFGGSYGRLLKTIVAANPKVQLICLGPWRGEDDSAPYEAQIRDRCYEHNGRYIRLSPTYQNPQNRGPSGTATYDGPSDNFHPNDEGHAAIAQLVMGRVEESAA